MIKIIGCNRFRTKRRVFSNSPTVSRLKARWSCLHTLDSESLPLQLNKLCSWHIGLESNPKKTVHKFLGCWLMGFQRTCDSCHVAIPSCTKWGAISTYSARGSNPPCSWDAWSLKTVAKCVGTKPGFGHPKSCPYTTCPQKRPEETTTYLFQTMPMYGTYNSFSNQLRVNWVGNLWRKRGGKFRLDSFR